MMSHRLKKARKDKKWTLEEAAERCGITPQYLSELERGVKNNPRILTLAKIIDVYGNKNILDDFIPKTVA